MINNTSLVQQVVFALKDLNVKEIIICAGARNIPIVEFLEQYNKTQKEKFQLSSFFEERSAAFYALGRIKATSRPVAVVTTSGTAAVETFPAVVEAYYQSLPLIVVSADRPKAYRGSGAPQAIEQAGLFKNYCHSAIDWDGTENEFSIQFNPQRPLHFNLCFEEPLIDQPEKFRKKYQIKNEFQTLTSLSLEPRKLNPLVIVSELDPEQRAVVFEFLKESKLYFIAESLSGLKNHPDLKAQELGTVFYSLTNQQSIQVCIDHFDSIVRIGGVPTLRLWRDLEYDLKNLPALSFSDRPFSGLSRLSRVFVLKDLRRLKVTARKNFDLEKLRDSIVESQQKLLKKFHQSEQSFFMALAEIVGADPLYLGNSLPIREWDEFSRAQQFKQLVYGNRGANGIDGQVSTYLAWARDLKRSWCVVGDLTALYDLAALTMATKSKTQKTIVIINNSGGQIFSRLFKNQKYLNGHQLSFKSWAQMFDWDYCEVKSLSDLKKRPRKRNTIIEIKIKNSISDRYLKQSKLIAQKLFLAAVR